MVNKHPKRKREKNNPYKLYNDGELMAVSFVDVNKVKQTVQISVAIYNAFDQFELEENRYLTEYGRNIERSELSDSTLYKRAVSKPKLLEEILDDGEENEKLHKALNKLSGIQRRRFLLRYLHNHTYDEIAEIERCSKHSAYVSVCRAKEKLKKFLKTF